MTPGITSDHEAEERAVGSGAAAIPSGSVTHADSRAGWVAGGGGEAKGERGGERNGMGGGYGSGGGGGGGARRERQEEERHGFGGSLPR